jgi:hypothetical protein
MNLHGGGNEIDLGLIIFWGAVALFIVPRIFRGIMRVLFR